MSSAQSASPESETVARTYDLPSIRDRNRDNAIHHATMLQERKDIELQILTSIETLIESPSSQSADPAHPNATEASHFTTLLKVFQPSDYDSLIQERNINGKCGYALCSRPRRLQNTNANFRILRKKGLQIVPRAQLEQFCSEDCAKRAVYVKVQLDDQPAWMRAPCHNIQPVLFDASRTSWQNRTPSEGGLFGLKGNIDSLDKDDHTGRRATDARNLALERGDRCDSSGLVDVALRENHQPLAPCIDLESMLSGLRVSEATTSSIEGYVPKDIAKV
ncbi:MAG: hypothetical protein Q9224_007597 [Gallowayella concinna]